MSGTRPRSDSTTSAFSSTAPRTSITGLPGCSEHAVRMRTEPRTHRDGARSFYCYDPDGTLVQMIHHPQVVPWEELRGLN